VGVHPTGYLRQDALDLRRDVGLAWLDRDAFTRLSTIPVHFHRRQKAFESLQVRPILGALPDGRFQIRYSYFTIDPQRLPFPEMEAWYRAYNRFAALVRNPSY